MVRQPIFDAVRRLLGRGFQQDEVAGLDAAIDRALAADDPSPSPRRIGEDGIALIKQFEGCARILKDGRVEAYPDLGTGGAPWTIGWGATGAGIGPGTIWTRQQCDARLEEDLGRYASEVANAIGATPTTQGQFDALTSFHYNTGAIGRASLTALHRDGDFEAAARQFARWIYAGGRVMAGLVKRREAEALLYRNG